jgi:hypothetical protein
MKITKSRRLAFLPIILFDKFNKVNSEGNKQLQERQTSTFITNDYRSVVVE